MGACPELERDTSKDTTQNFSLTKKNDDLFVQLFIRPHNVTLAAIAAIVVSIVRSIGGYKPPFPILKRRSVFDRIAQRNVFRRRDVRQQPRSCVLHHPKLRRSPTPSRFAEIVSYDLPVLHAAGLRFTDCSERFAVVRSTTTGGSSAPDMAHLLGVASLVLGDVSDPDL